MSHDLPRKNYLSKVIKPFVGVIMDDEGIYIFVDMVSNCFSDMKNGKADIVFSIFM